MENETKQMKKMEKCQTETAKMPSSAVLFYERSFFGFKFLISIDLHSNWHSSFVHFSSSFF